MTYKQDNGRKDIISSYSQALKSFGKSLPIVLGVILLLGLFRVFVSNQMLSAVFRGELLHDTLIGSVAGAVSAGNAVTSYIIGGELAKEGVSLIAITAFMVAWVTVGTIQLPAEAGMLGLRFAGIRNGSGFVFSILIALATVETLMVIQ